MLAIPAISWISYKHKPVLDSVNEVHLKEKDLVTNYYGLQTQHPT